MIPPVTHREVTIGGSQSSASFEISSADSAHVMSILREGLYSDKILAILREYSANAWDAHRSIGKHELPIKVTLPTQYEPVLLIRDFGPGLSHADVFNVYTQYGRSTKRLSNDVVGQLGIGSKSGFAYSDSFTITSWHGGVQRIYVATLGEDEKGSINLLHEAALFCECGDAEHGLDCPMLETGVEIQIATKPSDRYEFEGTARRLFQHFRPRPEINIELPALPDEQTVLTNGTIMPGDGEWIAVMGCIPYRVNLSQLDQREISPCLRNMGGQLSFGIGEVAMSASREELKYTTQTKTALVAKLNALVDEFVTHAFAQLSTGQFSGWETRLRVLVLSQLDLPLPEEWKQFAEGFAKVTYEPGDFTIIHNKSACTRLTVTQSTRLLIDDTGNDLSGYYFNHEDYVVRSPSKTAAELRTALDAALATSKLTGVRIELLSTLHWTAPFVPAKRKSNPKHRARMFQLTDDTSYAAPWSDHWTPVLRTPTTDDVFVVIEGFKAEGYKEFFHHYVEDRKIAEAFGCVMPTVYGYKTTNKKPVSAIDCAGISYRDWREAFIKSLLTPENLELIELWWYANPEGTSYRDEPPSKNQLAWLTTQLGDQHQLVELWVTAAQASARIRKHSMIGQLAVRAGLTYSKSSAAITMKTVRERYPLLRRAGLRELWAGAIYGDDKGIRELWVEYVQMIDAKHSVTPNNVVQLKSVP